MSLSPLGAGLPGASLNETDRSPNSFLTKINAAEETGINLVFTMSSA